MNPWNVMNRARLDAESMTEAVLDEAANALDVMSVDEARAQVRIMRAALVALVAAYDVRGPRHPQALGSGVDWDPEPQQEQAADAWAAAVRTIEAPGVVR